MQSIDFVIAEKLENHLKECGVAFNEDGFPIHPNGVFAEEEPDFIAPWQRRKYYKASETALSFYMPDDLIYPRFEKIEEEAEEFKRFKSVVSMDLSVSRNMPLEVQRFGMKMNALYTACMALKGRKIIPSLRCGDERTINYLLPYKGAPLMALGIHGCKGVTFADYDEFIFRCEVIILRPKKLLLYGVPTKRERELLDDVGVPYRAYPDFRALYGREGTGND